MMEIVWRWADGGDAVDHPGFQISRRGAVRPPRIEIRGYDSTKSAFADCIVGILASDG
jgi:hypothetical protein